MNYPEFFKKLQSRVHLEELLIYLAEHPEDFNEVFELALGEDQKKGWRALWACEKVCQRSPEMFDDKKIQRITTMVLTTRHQGMHRIGLSVLNSLPVPDPLDVDMLNALYEWMLSPAFSIGVQSLSMKLLYRYCLTNEDLLREYILILQQADDEDYTVAFRSSKRNILKAFNRL